MHLEICSHSARSGLIISDMVKRHLQLCLIQLPLSESTCARFSFQLLSPFPGTHLVGYGVAVVWELSATSPSVLWMHLDVELWCSTWPCRDLCVTLVSPMGTLHMQQKDKNSVVRSGKELYLLCLPLPSLLPLKQIIFFISFVFLFIRNLIKIIRTIHV